MNVAYENNRGSQRSGLQQMIRQHGVHHGRLIHNQQAAGQRVILVTGETILFRGVLKKSMNGPRLASTGFGHAFGSPPCGRGQQNLGPVFGENLNNGIQYRRLFLYPVLQSKS